MALDGTSNQTSSQSGLFAGARAGADAKVCEMRMVPGLDRKFVAQRKHPNATGFMRNLYKIDGVPEQASQHLETNFMKPLDTRASTALNLMLSDQAHDVVNGVIGTSSTITSGACGPRHRGTCRKVP